MTEKLYYQDATLKTFNARVVERWTHEGRPAVVLDRTAFYPTGGGQPNDRGRLGDVLVVDVIEREADGEVIHVLDPGKGSGTFPARSCVRFITSRKMLTKDSKAASP